MSERWLTALAAHGLPGAPELGPVPGDLEPMHRDVRHHRLAGVWAAAVESGVLEIDDGVRRSLSLAHEAAMREVLLLEDMLLEATAVLRAEGIEPLVLKGSALAHLVHPDPSQRCFGDIDLLVAASDVDAAVVALVAAGATRPRRELAPGFDRRFAKSVTLRWREGTELDLHRTLAAGPYGFLIHLDELVAEPEEFSLAGRRLHTLRLEHHLIHAAVHLALGDVEVRLGNVRDLALLCRQPSVDAGRVRAIAARWGVEAPVAVGLQSLAELGSTPSPLEEWATAFSPNRRDAHRLSVYRRRRGRYRRQALASIPVLGWRDRVAFSRGLLASRRR